MHELPRKTKGLQEIWFYDDSLCLQNLRLSTKVSFISKGGRYNYHHKSILAKAYGSKSNQKTSMRIRGKSQQIILSDSLQKTNWENQG
jgi:hypothetical protein